MRKNKTTSKIVQINRASSQIRNSSEFEETEQLPQIKPKSVVRSSKKNFDIKKVRMKIAVSEDKLESSTKFNKLDPIKKEESPPISDIRKTTPFQIKSNKIKDESKQSIHDNNIESYYIDNEESLENNINTYLKMYNCLVNLIEGMRKGVVELVDQINRYLEVIDGIHFCSLEQLFNENPKQFRQIMILIKLGVAVIVNGFFDQHGYMTNLVNFKNILIYNLQNYLYLGDLILMKTQSQELLSLLNCNKKLIGSKKVESSTQIRQNVELLQGLYRQLIKPQREFYTFLNSFLRQIPHQKLIQSNISLQNYISLYFTLQQTYQGLLGIPLICVASKPYFNKQQSHKFTLILDMDETLIHFIDQTKIFLIRPFTEQFLDEMNNYFELVIFTAGLPDYANWVLDQFDKKKLIKYRLYRQHAMQYQNHFIKDLSRIGRNLKKCIIIDNIADNFQHQPENGIFIKTWTNDPDDIALLELIPFLKQIVIDDCEDVREVLKNYKSNQLPQL